MFSGAALRTTSPSPVATFEAEIGETKYKTLAEAVEAAADGDTIKIINTNEVGDIKEVEVSNLWIEKQLTIDLNGRGVSSPDLRSFCLSESTGKLALVNSGEDKVSLAGSILCTDIDCSLTVGDKIVMENQLWHNQNTAINGTHHRLSLLSDSDLNNGKTMPVTFGDDFRYTGGEGTIDFFLAESIDDLNDS